MTADYEVEPDEHSFTAACIALKESRMKGFDALLEAQQLETLILKSGEPLYNYSIDLKCVGCAH